MTPKNLKNQQRQSLNTNIKSSALTIIPYDQALRTLSSNPISMANEKELRAINFKSLCAITDQLLWFAPGMIDWKNSDSEFLGCNDTVAKIAGLKSLKDIVGKTDEDFIWGKNGQADYFRKVDKEAMKGQVIFDIGRVQHPDKMRLLCVKKIPLIIKDKVVGVVDFLTEMDDSSTLSIVSSLDKLGIDITVDIIAKVKQYATIDNFYSLNERQKECLFYLLRGYTAKEIAKALDLSFRTIEDYVGSIKDIFQCTSKSSLIKKAINLGYINVYPEKFIIEMFINDSS